MSDTALRIGSLFSGSGALERGVLAAIGGSVAWHCENDPHAARVLAFHDPHIPNLGDITAVDWDAVEPVDVLTGGFPCQDVSTAGARAGLRPGTRSGLWEHMSYAIARLRPSLVVIENVRGLLFASAHSDLEPCPWCVGDTPAGDLLRALGAVLGDLAVLGYDAQWLGLPASEAGAPHERFRVFILAWPAAGGAVPDADRDALRQQPVGVTGIGGAPVAGRAGAPAADPPDPTADPDYAAGDRERARPESVRGAAADPDGSGRGAGDRTIRAGSAQPVTARDPAPAADPALLGRGPRGGALGAGPAQPRPDGDRPPAADAERQRRTGREPGDPGGPQRPGQPRPAAAGHGPAAADASAGERGWAQPADPQAQAGRPGEPGERAGGDPADGLTDWGIYAPAIERWERVLGRAVPAPTVLNSRGTPKLAAEFVEWMMGLPAGWVTAVPGVGYNEQLKILGNGVVPQQAELAIRALLTSLGIPTAEAA